MSKILITGGAGYVGSCLTPYLLEKGHQVRVLDALIYTPAGLDALKNHPSFSQWQDRYEFIHGDIRNPEVVEKSLEGVNAVIHLAALSNDSVCDIDEVVTREVNFGATALLLHLARQKGVERFINTSTASVMGAKKEDVVTEQLEPEPITLYAKYKMLSEWLVFTAASSNFCAVNIRPSTICGHSFRQRFDLTVNKLVADAMVKKRIMVHSGIQRRPSVGMTDILNLYEKLLSADMASMNGRTFHFGFENYPILELAKMIQSQLQDLNVEIRVLESTDTRDFHISSEKIKQTLGYQPISNLQQEIQNLRRAFDANQFPDVEAPEYYNIRTIKIARMPSCYNLFSR